MKKLALTTFFFILVACTFGNYVCAEMRMEFRTVYLNALEQVDKGITKADVAKLFEAVPDLTELEKGYVSLVLALAAWNEATGMKSGIPERSKAMEHVKQNVEKFKAATADAETDDIARVIADSTLAIANIEIELGEICREAEANPEDRTVSEYMAVLSLGIYKCEENREKIRGICDEMLKEALVAADKVGDADLDSVVPYPQDVCCAIRMEGECSAFSLYSHGLLEAYRTKCWLLISTGGSLVESAEEHLFDASYESHYRYRDDLVRFSEDFVLDKLKKEKVTCDINNMNLTEAILTINGLSESTIMWDFLEKQDYMITINIQDKTLYETITIICHLLNLNWFVSCGFVILYDTKDRPSPSRVLEITPKSQMERTADYSPYNDSLPLRVRKIWRSMIKRIDVVYVNVPFSDIVAEIEKLSGVKIEFEADVTEGKNDPITLKLNDFELGVLLSWCCRIAGLRYRIEKDRIVIHNPVDDDDN